MAVADNPKGFRPRHPNNSRVRVIQEAGSQTFARGDALILSSGQVAIATAGSAELCGVAAEPSSGTQATLIKVWADPATVFVGRTDAADAVTVGTACDIIGATGAMQLDANATATNVVLPIGEVDNAQADAAGKEYEFIINKHAFANTST